jgi:hypothetical protein
MINIKAQTPAMVAFSLLSHWMLNYPEARKEKMAVIGYILKQIFP